MKNRIKKPKANISVNKSPDLNHELGALQKKLETANLRITVLEQQLVDAKSKNDIPWKFNIERDNYGRITEVVAKKSTASLN